MKKNCDGKFQSGNIASMALMLAFSLFLVIIFTVVDLMTPSYVKQENFSFKERVDLSRADVLDIEVIGNCYTATTHDPRIFLPATDKAINKITIKFSEPLQQNHDIKLYYATDNQKLSEDNTVHSTLFPGDEYYELDLEENIYTALRLDISGQYYIDSIYLCNYLIKDVIVPDYLAWIIFSVSAFLLLVVFVFFRKKIIADIYESKKNFLKSYKYIIIVVGFIAGFTLIINYLFDPSSFDVKVNVSDFTIVTVLLSIYPLVNACICRLLMFKEKQMNVQLVVIWLISAISFSFCLTALYNRISLNLVVTSSLFTAASILRTLVFSIIVFPVSAFLFFDPKKTAGFLFAKRWLIAATVFVVLVANNLNVLYVSITDSGSLDNTLLISIILLFIFALVYLTLILKKEKRERLRSFILSACGNVKYVILFIASYIITLSLTIRYIPISSDLVNETYSGSNPTIKLIAQYVVILSSVSPIIQLLIFAASCAAVYFTWKYIDNKFSIWPALMSLIMTLTTMCGDSFYKTDSLDMLLSREPVQLFVNIVTFSGLFIIFYLISASLFEMIDKHQNKEPVFKNKLVNKLYGVYCRHNILFLTVVILLAWLPYIVVYYPGIIPSDTAAQFSMWFMNKKWDNNSPLFSTFLNCGFVEIGRLFGSDNLGVFLYSLLQTVILSLVLSFSLYELRKHGVPRIYRIIWLGSVLICPVYPYSALQVGKDTNYTISLIIFVLILFLFIEDPDKNINAKMLVFFTLDSLYMTLIRHNGIYVLILSSVAVFYFIKNKTNFLKISACFLAAIIGFFASSKMIDAIITAKNISNGYEIEVRDENFYSGGIFTGFMSNITARYISKYYSELTDEELQIFDRVYDVDGLVSVYDPEVTDFARSKYRTTVTKEEYSDFEKQFVKLFFRHPLVYIEGFFNKCYGYLYTNSFGKAKDYVWHGINTSVAANPNIDIHNAYGGIGASGPQYEIYWKMTALRQFPIVSVLSNIGIYSWLIFFVIFKLLSSRRFKELLITVPILSSLAVCIFSPVNAYIRYSLPVIFGSPLLILLCYINKKENTVKACTISSANSKDRITVYNGNAVMRFDNPVSETKNICEKPNKNARKKKRKKRR